MASIDRYRPAREGYQPPALPQTKPGAPPPSIPVPPPPPPPSQSQSQPQSQPQSPASSAPPRDASDIPPAVPSPPPFPSRTSPPAGAAWPAAAARRTSASPLRPRSSRHHHAQPPYQPPPYQQQHRPPGYQHAPPRSQSAQPPFASQWFYTEEELRSTPSVLHGLSPTEEAERRTKGVNFIYQAGITVQPHSLPQVTLYVASVFFHRFYMRTSMVEERGGIHHYKIAATALFLANKTEENCFKTKSLIIAVAKIAQKNADLIIDEQSKEYWRWRDVILAYEELMLEMLTFDLVVANPYDQLWVQLRRLDQLSCSALRGAAWAVLNDTPMTTLPLQLDASDLASAAIFFGSVASGTQLDDVHGQPWWHHLHADEARITRATHAMVAFYTENPMRNKHRNGRIQGSPVFQLESTRRPHEASRPSSSQYPDGGGGGGSTRGDGGARSRDVTPMELDRASRAPSQPPGQNQSRSQSQTQTLPALSQTAGPGDSDAALKAAANDLDHHGLDGANNNINNNSNNHGSSSHAAPPTNGAQLPPPGERDRDRDRNRKRKSAEPDGDDGSRRDRADDNEAADDVDREAARRSESKTGGHVNGGDDDDDDHRPAKRARRLSSGEVSEDGER